jgi:hypothetical protein
MRFSLCKIEMCDRWQLQVGNDWNIECYASNAEVRGYVGRGINNPMKASRLGRWQSQVRL